MKLSLCKIYLLALVVMLSIFSAKAQTNLVPNPSFENTSGSTFGCPGYGNLVNWVNPDPTDSCSTPDLFSTGCTGVFAILGDPSNGQGNQAARTGNNYGGFIVSDIPADNYREYVETPLTTPLVAGVSYCVTFYVSLGDDSPDGTNRIGLYFSNTLTQFTTNNCTNTAPLPYVPQLQAPSSPILDKTNWVQLQWNYTAVGGENYITIGNFFNQANTTLTSAGSGSQPFSYYYIDDVSIIAGPCCNNYITPAGPFCSTAPSTTLTAQSTGGTWSGAGITNSVTGTFNPAVAGAGTHVITYSLSCGAGTTTITVDACATLNVCQNNNNLTVSGGTAPYTWSSVTSYTDCSGCPGGICFPPICSGVPSTSLTAIASNTATITAPSSYPIVVTDNATNSYTITSLGSVPSCSTCTTPVLTVNSATICSGSTATLTISGATTYSWIPGTNLSSTSSATVTADPESTITYTISGTTGTCSTTTIAKVTVNMPPDISVSGPSPVCAGNAINLNITTAATTYTWTGPNSFNSNVKNPIINNATTADGGVYSITAAGANGCAATHTININVVPSPTVTVSTTSICIGGSGTLTASGASTYTWSTTQTGSSIVVTPTVTTTYTVTGTDANSCIDNTTVSQVVTNCTAGINQQYASNSALTIYPNPNTGTFVIETNNTTKQTIQMYDVNGKMVLSQSINGTTNIDAGALSDGVYTISIISNEGVINRKLVIVR
jgi:type IX secretion system substrate protein